MGINETVTEAGFNRAENLELRRQLINSESEIQRLNERISVDKARIKELAEKVNDLSVDSEQYRRSYEYYLKYYEYYKQSLLDVSKAIGGAGSNMTQLEMLSWINGASSKIADLTAKLDEERTAKMAAQARVEIAVKMWDTLAGAIGVRNQSQCLQWIQEAKQSGFEIADLRAKCAEYDNLLSKARAGFDGFPGYRVSGLERRDAVIDFLQNMGRFTFLTVDQVDIFNCIRSEMVRGLRNE